MTRKEEIKCASKDYINYLLDKQEYHNENYTEYDIQQAFEKGAQWTDTHPKSQWISVKDMLPEQDKEVIVLCDDLNIASFYKISFAHVVDKTMYQDYNGWNIPNIVYWFPMPKLPKEQEEML